MRYVHFDDDAECADGTKFALQFVSLLPSVPLYHHAVIKVRDISSETNIQRYVVFKNRLMNCYSNYY